MNGSDYFPETVRFTFAMEESPKGEYIVKFMLTFDDFYDEVSLPANVSNGRVYVDSIPTTFVVDPASLVNDNTIQLLQTENLTLSGTVLMDGRPTTLINDCRVISKVVQTFSETGNSSEQFIPSSYLFFDSKTGVITHVSVQLSDVLLNKLGVMFIIDGIYDLVDYSENLNFTLVRESTPLWVLLLISVFIILFVLVVLIAYKSLKKKRVKRKNCSNKTFKIPFTSKYSVGCSHGL